MNITCGKCGKSFTAGGIQPGANVLCPGCNTVLTIPGGPPAAAPISTPSRQPVAEETFAAQPPPRRRRPVPAAAPPKQTARQRSSFQSIAVGVAVLLIVSFIGMFVSGIVDDRVRASQSDPTNPKFLSHRGATGGNIHVADAGNRDRANERNDAASPFDRGNNPLDSGTDSAQQGGIKLPTDDDSKKKKIILPTDDKKKKEVIDDTKTKEKGDNNGRVEPGTGRMGGNILVEFLGTKARGDRFVIIADRSGSMVAGKWRFGGPQMDLIFRAKKSNMDFLHEELLKTLDMAEKKRAQVHVIFFDSVTTSMPKEVTANTWVRTKEEYDRLRAWVKTISPQGETEPLEAFKIALALQPPPDAIFFMTDGVCEPKKYAEKIYFMHKDLVTSLNKNVTDPKKKKTIPINCIQMDTPGIDKASVVLSLNGGTIPGGLETAIRDAKLEWIQNGYKLPGHAQQIYYMQLLSKSTGGEFKQIKSFQQEVQQ